MNDRPVISICISTHNDGVGACKPPHEKRALIRECLQSIVETLAYDSTPVEILIADDASTDDTADQIAAVVSDWELHEVLDRRPVKLLQVSECGGVGARLNELIAIARGELIVRMDGDIRMTSPGWAARVVEHFRQLPGTGLLGGVQMDALGGTVWAFGDSLFNRERKYKHQYNGAEYVNRGFLAQRDYLMLCFAAFRRSTWQVVAGFNPDLGRYEEVEFNLDVATACGGAPTYVTSDIVFEHRHRLRKKRSGCWDDPAEIERHRQAIADQWGFDWRSADPRKVIERWPGTVLADRAQMAINAEQASTTA